MKRAGFLIERIADIDNLLLAYTKAIRGKHLKREVKRFGEAFDDNIRLLHEALLQGTVRVGDYHYFTIYDPKERVICAASFPERVLHHAIMNVCHDYFDRSLIADTYATRKGKGVYAALDRAVWGATRHRYVVKLDYRKFYDSISHEVLFGQLLQKFKDERLLTLFHRIIDSYHVTPGYGLPIGNLTSQYFANSYLSSLDHRMKEVVRVPVYIRYMDDILMFADDAAFLRDAVRGMREYATDRLRLTLKSPIYRVTSSGVPFLGYKVYPHHYRLAGRSKRRFCHKMSIYKRLYDRNEWGEKEYQEHILPLLSFVEHACSKQYRKAVVEKG